MEPIGDSHKTSPDDCRNPGFVQTGKSAAAGFIWVAGLLLAGSDGPLMPWFNLLGVLMFAGITPVLASWFSCPGTSGSSPCHPRKTTRVSAAGEVSPVPPARHIKPPGVGNRKVIFSMNFPGRIFSKI